jgi:hypothetical protein
MACAINWLLCELHVCVCVSFAGWLVNTKQRLEANEDVKLSEYDEQQAYLSDLVDPILKEVRTHVCSVCVCVSESVHKSI